MTPPPNHPPDALTDASDSAASDSAASERLQVFVTDDPQTLDASAWDALLQAQPEPTPFMRHAYLAALHASGSAVPDTGWGACFVTVQRGQALVAAAPAYLKSHSHGEYVFDWAWADAYRRHGLRYYPKLLVAVPFTPVPGTRLMATDRQAQQVLQQGLLALAEAQEASSVHVLFQPEAEGNRTGEEPGWMTRRGVQFHWQRARGSDWRSLDDFLDTMQRDKRKKIRQERRRVAEAGVSFTVHEGLDIDDGLWRFFHHCYALTYRAHHSRPYLNLGFFQSVGRDLPQHWLMFVARREGQPIGASLVAIDRERQVAWGRYWGAVESVPCLHFETCYYQPLAWCIAEGFQRFEGGAQGEHKMARGLMPVPTRSAHWLAHPRFAQAVDDYLKQETEGIAGYMDELREHQPFKRDAV